MFRQKTFTVVLVTYDTVARVDVMVGDSLNIVFADRVERPSQAELSDAIRRGLELGPTNCGDVFVLSDEFWSGSVTLADAVVEAVPTDQLGQTIALEIEQESGISPFESRVGLAGKSSRDGQTTWSVVQADQSQLHAINEDLPQFVTHITAVAGILLIGNTDPSGGMVQATDDVESCKSFVAKWIETYLSSTDLLPIILLERPGWTDQQRRRLAVASTLAVLVVISVTHVLGSQRSERLNAELAQVVAKEEQVRKRISGADERTRELLEVKRERDESRADRVRRLRGLRAMRDQQASRRKRPLQILRVLATTADPGHWIQRIEWNESAVITGVALDTNSVTSLAGKIETQLDSSLWLVQPPKMVTDDSTQLVRFDLKLYPLMDVEASVAAVSGGGGDVH